jgi:hypothetical protein
MRRRLKAEGKRHKAKGEGRRAKGSRQNKNEVMDNQIEWAYFFVRANLKVCHFSMRNFNWLVSHQLI